MAENLKKSKPKLKIIFDFDHTLFSARKLYQALEDGFKKIGVPRKLFKETFEESKGKGRDYKPSSQFNLIIKKRPGIPLQELEKNFEEILNKADKFLYPDVRPFLSKVKNKFNLVLLSYGEDEFQREKIAKSNITNFFQKIFTTSDINKVSTFKKIVVSKSGSDLKEETIFIDDNPGALFEIKKQFPNVLTIRINRGEGKYTEEKNNQNIDFNVKNLKELEKILKKYAKL
jgi:FMN phosphatase YigB (HAD superfamily)